MSKHSTTFSTMMTTSSDTRRHNAMARFVTCLLVALAVVIATPLTEGKKKVVDIYELSLDENLVQPEITNQKHLLRVQDYQYNTAIDIKNQNYDVELMRDQQVIVVTIPASQLFDANDTILTDVGKAVIRPLLKYLANPGFYKMLLVMHSDNTGSDAYTLGLTRDRVNAVFDWIDEQAGTEFVVPYALGPTEPLVDNNSFENRRLNRRLEIYLVPEEVMLDQAKRGNVNINIVRH